MRQSYNRNWDQKEEKRQMKNRKKNEKEIKEIWRRRSAGAGACRTVSGSVGAAEKALLTARRPLLTPAVIHDLAAVQPSICVVSEVIDMARHNAGVHSHGRAEGRR